MAGQGLEVRTFWCLHQDVSVWDLPTPRIMNASAALDVYKGT